MPENIASFGADIDSLALLITGIVGIAFIICEAVLLGAAWGFRRRPGRRAAYITGEAWRHTRWVLVPVLLVVAGDVFIDLRTTSAWERIKQHRPEPDVVVRIAGQQFAWSFTYPGRDGRLGTEDDIVAVNELHVPVDATVTFVLEARDVLHSFWVPSLRLKQDAVPGRSIQGWFKATKPGQYDIACAEICGVAHGAMKATLTVHTKDDYTRWLAAAEAEAHPREAPPAAAPAAGAKETPRS